MARRDLALTEVSAPFDLRVTEKLVDFADYVTKGKTLLTADATNAVEIQAQFPLGKMRPLRRNTPTPQQTNNHTAISPLRSSSTLMIRR